MTELSKAFTAICDAYPIERYKRDHTKGNASRGGAPGGDFNPKYQLLLTGLDEGVPLNKPKAKGRPTATIGFRGTEKRTLGIKKPLAMVFKKQDL